MPSTSNSKDIWTNSRATTARRCLREHKLRYTDGWRLRPNEEADALHMGSAVHRGLEAWWSRACDPDWTGPDHALIENVLYVMRDPTNRARTELEQVRSEEWMRGYHRVWAPTRASWRVVGVELEWYCDMPNPDTSGVSKTWQLGGKFDVLAVYQGPPTHWFRDGDHWVIEHKTTSESLDDNSEYWVRKLMDSQVSQYEVGALSIGVELAGTLLDVGRKAAIRPLSKTKNIRQKKNETDDEFEERCRIEAPPETMEQFRVRLAEKYDEPGMFVRKPIPRTSNDLELWMRDAWTHSTFIRQATRQGLAPRNPDACTQMGRCIFFDHCAYGSSLAGDARFMQDADWPHPELRKPE